MLNNEHFAKHFAERFIKACRIKGKVLFCKINTRNNFKPTHFAVCGPRPALQFLKKCVTIG